MREMADLTRVHHVKMEPAMENLWGHPSAVDHESQPPRTQVAPRWRQRRQRPPQVAHRPITRSLTRAARLQAASLIGVYQQYPIQNSSPHVSHSSTYSHNGALHHKNRSKPRRQRVRSRIPPLHRGLHRHTLQPPNSHSSHRQKKPHVCSRRRLHSHHHRRKRGTAMHSPHDYQRTVLSDGKKSLQSPSHTYTSDSYASPGSDHMSPTHPLLHRHQHPGQASPRQHTNPTSTAASASQHISHVHTSPSSREQQSRQASPQKQVYMSLVSPAPHRVPHAQTSRQQIQGQASSHRDASLNGQHHGHASSPVLHSGQTAVNQGQVSPGRVSLGPISQHPHHHQQSTHAPASSRHTSAIGPHQGRVSPHQQHQGQGSLQMPLHHEETPPHMQRQQHSSPQQEHPSPRENHANLSPYEVFSKEQQKKAFVHMVLPSRSPPPSPQASHQSQSPRSPCIRSPTSQPHGNENTQILGNGSGVAPTSMAHAHVNSRKRTHLVTNDLKQQEAKLMRVSHQEKASDVRDAMQGRSPSHASKGASLPNMSMRLQQQKGAPFGQQQSPRVQQLPLQGSPIVRPSYNGSHAQSPRPFMQQVAVRQPQQVRDYSCQNFYGQSSPQYASSVIPGLGTSPPQNFAPQSPQRGNPYSMNLGQAQYFMPSSSSVYLPQVQALQYAHNAQQRFVQQPQHPAAYGRDFDNMQHQALLNSNSFTSGAGPSSSGQQTNTSSIGSHATQNYSQGHGAHEPTSSSGQPPFSHSLSPPTPSRRHSDQRDIAINGHGASHSNGNKSAPSSRRSSNSPPSQQQLSSMPMPTESSSTASTPSSYFDRYSGTPGLQYMHP